MKNPDLAVEPGRALLLGGGDDVFLARLLVENVPLVVHARGVLTAPVREQVEPVLPEGGGDDGGVGALVHEGRVVAGLHLGGGGRARHRLHLTLEQRHVQAPEMEEVLEEEVVEEVAVE